jgi:hypothetical protein
MCLRGDGSIDSLAFGDFCGSTNGDEWIDVFGFGDFGRITGAFDGD